MIADLHPAKDRRKELVLVAYNQIAKKGFEGLRVRDVATEVGINNATLHYYFPTKEDLIKAVVDSMIQRFSTSFSSAPTGKRGAPDAWEEVYAELVDARQRPRKTPDQLVVYTELLLRSLRDPSVARIFRKLDESWRGYLVALIKKGVNQGIFREELDPTATAILIMLQIKGMGLQILGEAKREIKNDVFDQLVQQIKSWLSGEFKNKQKPRTR